MKAAPLRRGIEEGSIMEKRIERIKAEIAELVEDLEDAYMDEGLNLAIDSGKVLRDLGEAERKARENLYAIYR